MISTDPKKKRTQEEEFANVMPGQPRTGGDLIQMTVRDYLDRNIV